MFKSHCIPLENFHLKTISIKHLHLILFLLSLKAEASYQYSFIHSYSKRLYLKYFIWFCFFISFISFTTNANRFPRKKKIIIKKQQQNICFKYLITICRSIVETNWTELQWRGVQENSFLISIFMLSNMRNTNKCLKYF